MFDQTDMLFSLGYLKPAFSKEDELSQKLDHFLRGVEKVWAPALLFSWDLC